MGLKVETIRDRKEAIEMAKAWTADRDLFLDARQENVVEAGDDGAAYLLCRAGQKVRPDLVAQYKLRDQPELESEPEAPEEPAEEAESVEKPKKSRRKAVEKGGDK